MTWKRFENGKRLETFDEEPKQSGVNLPPNLFVVGCGGCESDGRVLVDHRGDELFRETWSVEAGSYDKRLSDFYDRVKTYLSDRIVKSDISKSLNGN